MLVYCHHLIVTIEYKCYQPQHCTPWRWRWWAHGRTVPPSPASPYLCCTETPPACKSKYVKFYVSMFWLALIKHSSSGHDVTHRNSVSTARSNFPRVSKVCSANLHLVTAAQQIVILTAIKISTKATDFPLKHTQINFISQLYILRWVVVTHIADILKGKNNF